MSHLALTVAAATTCLFTAVLIVRYSGLPDMIELVRLNIVTIFTCANDYADVKVGTMQP